jgi:hypothetical protein
MKIAGKTQQQIDSRLATKFGLIPASTSPRIVTPFDGTGGSALVLSAPTIYRDACAGVYTATANYHFTAWTDGLSLNGGNVGGDDGFGIAFSRKVTTVVDYSMATWGKTSHYARSYSRLHVETANTDGVTYVGQDTAWRNPTQMVGPQDYNFYNGSLVYDIGNIGCGSIQAFSKYGHDWSSTDITGFGVGPWSLSLQWSSSTHRWEKSSQPSNAVTVC